MRRTTVRTASPVLLSDPVGDEYVHGQSLAPRPPVPTSPTISVVIPTLNEAGNLPYVLNTIPRWVDEVVIVDGRSLDDTARVAKVLRPDARIVHQTRPGKGAALRSGLEAARGDLLIIMDADGSMDGADIELIRDQLVAGADYVKGSRFAEGGGSTDITRLRRFGDAGICWLIRLFFGARYSDGTYGFKGLWASNLDAVRPDTDGFEVELLLDIRAHRAGLRVAEVPCFETNRIHGASNLNALSDGLRCLRVILRERLRRYRVPPT
jgi:glycosyltransferase involved in cell wall biosynthesis